jgi:hypothetical protein
MAWRSSFGVTVLLALVVLCLSMLIELASSDPVQLDKDRVQLDFTPTDEKVRSMLERMLGLKIKVRDELWTGVKSDIFDNMFDLWQADETKCSHIFFIWAEEWSRRLNAIDGGALIGVISKWKKTCYSRLEGTIQSELETMKESTREQFQLFAEQDQAECRSEGNFKCLLFSSPDLMINKLRRVIGSPKDTDVDELRAAERFVSACKEMAASDAIKRTNYEESTPRSTEPYFPHIRFYDYCERLLDVE